MEVPMHRRVRSPAALPGLVVRTLRSRLKQAGFWLSVLLPMTYLPILYSIDGQSQALVLAGLVVLNVVSLVVSHDYSR